MKLIFIGNEFKYEIEAIMKLFIPASRFEFLYTDSFEDSNGEYAAVVREFKDDKTVLDVKVRYDGKDSQKQLCLEADAADGDCERELSKLLYLCMSEITGIKSQWGIMTGVRPVKQIHRLLEKGCSKDEVYKILGEKYLVSAEKFSLAYDTAQVQKPLLENLEKANGRTFGLYISIPFCPTRCSYCSFISQSASGNSVKKLIAPYVENLCAEIEYTAKITNKLGLRPDTVYFGGGTPTTLSAAHLARIMRTISQSFDMSEVKEYTIEAGRPDTVTEDKLAAIKENGCTRISINPQTLNDEVLKEIGRAHTVEQFYDSFKLAREMGFESINTDVIAGLPTDTPESFMKTIDGLIDLSPESITVHTLSIKRSARLNSSEEKSDILKSPASVMVEYATKRLYEAGYKPYYMYRQKNMIENLENIGWVKPGFESLYNIYIMEEVQTIIALGAAGSTKLVDLKNGRLERVFNFKYPIDYNRSFDQMLKRKFEIEKFFKEIN